MQLRPCNVSSVTLTLVFAAGMQGHGSGIDLVRTGHGDGTCVLTWGQDGCVYLHNTATGKKVGSL